MPDTATQRAIKLQMVASAPHADFAIVFGFAMFMGAVPGPPRIRTI
jgi:hypothetical protein